MALLRVHNFAVSLDGYGAGPAQSMADPLGVGGMALHAWAHVTRAFQAMIGKDGGETGANNDFMERGTENVGAWILGRNMFGPVRGPWPDEAWKGWWGDNPPYHAPVFVLTNHARAPLSMDGGTTFHFVTGGIDDALRQAFAAAGSKDVRLAGGVSTLRQYLTAGLIDELHFAVAPVMLGSGEPLFAGLDLPKLGYRVARHVPGENVTHVVLEKIAR